jgi:hypothetical protein
MKDSRFWEGNEEEFEEKKCVGIEYRQRSFYGGGFQW